MEKEKGIIETDRADRPRDRHTEIDRLRQTDKLRDGQMSGQTNEQRDTETAIKYLLEQGGNLTRNMPKRAAIFLSMKKMPVGNRE